MKDCVLTDFYTSLPRFDDFAVVADATRYVPLPQDWWVCTSDIVDSTRLVAEGRYKTVNMVGAAVISAQINAHEGAAFPYVFGGDGAGFAVPPAWQDRAAAALAAVRVWARDAFEIDLRVGMVQVADVRAAGRDVTVARFQPTPDVDYAMFAGGGLHWAETRMKAGAHDVPQAPEGSAPDLTGLSCRWSHMPSRHGVILSLVVMPADTVPGPLFSQIAQQIVALSGTLAEAGHPARDAGPGVRWPPAGARLEAHAQRKGGTLGAALRKALFESFVAWVLIKTGLKVGGFDARRYRRIVGRNADFRKFDDGLKMTLDCDPDTQAALTALLEKASQDGIIQYGMHTQTEAMMTCIVPSILTDDHVHFIDGASGGYTSAAQGIKAG